MRTFVLADVHLTRRAGGAVAAALAAFFREHPGSRIVVAGDLFDPAAELPCSREVDPILEAHPDVRAAMGVHLTRGGELWLASGNHDASVADPSFAGRLGDALLLDASSRGRIRTTPWFFRFGEVHVEHGHVYDPDNAPEHPLVTGERSLGVHFVESFIAKTGAHAYLNANDKTPLHLFLSSFRMYGPRAPYIIYRFFVTAFSGLLRSGPLYRARHEGALGQGRIETFATAADVDPALVERAVALAAEPTLASTARTFARLYLDRVFATASLAAGAAMLARGDRGAAAAALAVGAATMVGSWAHGHNRYGGSVASRLEASACRVAATTGARLVVFGHTHREALEGTYANTGSFAFPGRAPGRPYLELELDRAVPRAIRRYGPLGSDRSITMGV
jgi:UDP-2,3-diacylglucosamine pyrophosphatase LpxH